MPGRMDEMKGRVKETVGKATGDERLRSEGEADRIAGKAGREMQGAAEQVKGNVKMGAGKLVGNKRLHTEGQVEDVKGSLRRAG